jgi:hypothetical protein
VLFIGFGLSPKKLILKYGCHCGVVGGEAFQNGVGCEYLYS